MHPLCRRLRSSVFSIALLVVFGVNAKEELLAQVIDARQFQSSGGTKMIVKDDPTQIFDLKQRAKDYETACRILKERSQGDIYLVIKGGVKIEGITNVEALPNETLVMVFFGSGFQAQSRVLRVEDVDIFGQQLPKSGAIRIIGR